MPSEKPISEEFRKELSRYLIKKDFADDETPIAMEGLEPYSHAVYRTKIIPKLPNKEGLAALIEKQKINAPDKVREFHRRVAEPITSYLESQEIPHVFLDLSCQVFAKLNIDQIFHLASQEYVDEIIDDTPLM